MRPMEQQKCLRRNRQKSKEKNGGRERIAMRTARPDLAVLHIFHVVLQECGCIIDPRETTEEAPFQRRTRRRSLDFSRFEMASKRRENLISRMLCSDVPVRLKSVAANGTGEKPVLIFRQGLSPLLHRSMCLFSRQARINATRTRERAYMGSQKGLEKRRSRPSEKLKEKINLSR